MGRHLAGQTNDRHRIHQRIGQAGDRVGRAGTTRHEHDPDPPGGPCIALGGVDRTLLVPHQDVAQRVLLEQRVVDRQDGAAGIAEHDIDALIDQSLDDDIRSAQRLGRHDNLHRQQDRARRTRAAEELGAPGRGRNVVSYAGRVNKNRSIK